MSPYLDGHWPSGNDHSFLSGFYTIVLEFCGPSLGLRRWGTESLWLSTSPGNTFFWRNYTSVYNNLVFGRFHYSSYIKIFVWTARKGYPFHSQCAPYSYLYFKMAMCESLSFFFDSFELLFLAFVVQTSKWLISIDFFFVKSWIIV